MQSDTAPATNPHTDKKEWGFLHFAIILPCYVAASAKDDVL
jgi:hypothetical protein